MTGKIREVVERATTDAAFADELKQQAEQARRDGPGTDSWRVLMDHFATSPEHLERLASAEGPEPAGWTTVTTITTPECFMTTTTTGH